VFNHLHIKHGDDISTFIRKLSGYKSSV